MTFIRWVFAIAVLSVWIALIGTGLYVAMYEAKGDLPEAEAIVVLAGDASKNGGLVGETEARLNRAVALYDEGLAPRLILSGGTTSSAESVADAMKTAAMAAGVPDSAITVETESHSTLQNAMFVGDIEDLSKAAPILLVTHRYHLPRANASLRWAGFSDITNVAADPDGGLQITPSLLWESVKWPYNVLRAGAASAAEAGNVPREDYIQYLE
ncbi:MAG: YdcF family protein [Boseongicola sp.]|nr:YdcF family protein [Boseongicola sp.]